MIAEVWARGGSRTVAAMFRASGLGFRDYRSLNNMGYEGTSSREDGKKTWKEQKHGNCGYIWFIGLLLRC